MSTSWITDSEFRPIARSIFLVMPRRAFQRMIFV
jgi:hypothetical protein